MCQCRHQKRHAEANAEEGGADGKTHRSRGYGGRRLKGRMRHSHQKHEEKRRKTRPYRRCGKGFNTTRHCRPGGKTAERLAKSGDHAQHDTEPRRLVLTAHGLRGRTGTDGQQDPRQYTGNADALPARQGFAEEDITQHDGEGRGERKEQSGGARACRIDRREIGGACDDDAEQTGDGEITELPEFHRAPAAEHERHGGGHEESRNHL